MLIPLHHPLSDPSPPCWVCYLVAALATLILAIALATAFTEGYR